MNNRKNIKYSSEICVNFLCELPTEKNFCLSCIKTPQQAKIETAEQTGDISQRLSVNTQNKGAKEDVEKMEGIRIFQKNEAGAR